MDRRDEDVHDLVGRGVIETVHLRDVSRCRLGGGRVGEHVSGAGQRGGVRGVLLVTPFDQHHANVERQRGDQEQDDQSTREEHEDLAALSRAARRRYDRTPQRA